jgi:hypothetical protein
MGANALHCLVEKYAAFSGRRVVILGSGELAARTALMAVRNRLEVVAVIEVRDTPQNSPETGRELAAAGISILTSHVPRQALGGLEGVEQLIVSDGKGSDISFQCDTICVAIDVAPAIELLNAAGGATIADARRGGHVPVLTGWETSLTGVYAVGDCAGRMPTAIDASEQGRQAVRQAMGQAVVSSPVSGADAWDYQGAWMRALTLGVDPSLIVCQCEGVSRGDILAVRPPAYVPGPTEQSSRRSLSSLIADGSVDQDQVKRLTRACMGVCQARRCREQVAMTLAQAAGVDPSTVPLAGHRPPVRPLPLKILADWKESAAMTADWEPWFRIRGQWAAYEDIGTDREFTTTFGGG